MPLRMGILCERANRLFLIGSSSPHPPRRRLHLVPQAVPEEGAVAACRPSVRPSSDRTNRCGTDNEFFLPSPWEPPGTEGACIVDRRRQMLQVPFSQASGECCLLGR